MGDRKAPSPPPDLSQKPAPPPAPPSRGGTDIESMVDRCVRFVADVEHPERRGSIELFIDDKWQQFTTGDRNDMEDMHADIAMAIEQLLASARRPSSVSDATLTRIRQQAYWHVADRVEELRTRLACIGVAALSAGAAPATDVPLGHLEKELGISLEELLQERNAIMTLVGPHPVMSLVDQIAELVNSRALPPPQTETPDVCEGGVTCRWCPRCGRCSCPDQDGNPDRWIEDPACPIHGARSDHEEPAARPTAPTEAPVFPIPLNAEQEAAIAEWAKDEQVGDLWGNDEARTINLRTFARTILKLSAALPQSREGAK